MDAGDGSASGDVADVEDSCAITSCNGATPCQTLGSTSVTWTEAEFWQIELAAQIDASLPSDGEDAPAKLFAEF